MESHSPILAAVVEEFRKTKAYGDKAFAQLRDEDFFFRLNSQQCSIAAYIRHVAGNMQSRWTDFLTTDGEKPGRDREAEFAETVISHTELISIWESGWQTLFSTLCTLSDLDLERTVLIRNEKLTVIQALIRQIAHYAWHVGQVVLLAKHVKMGRGEAWGYMTIAPGQSKAFNQAKGL